MAVLKAAGADENIMCVSHDLIYTRFLFFSLSRADIHMMVAHCLHPVHN